MAADQFEVGAGLSAAVLARIVSAWSGRPGDLDDIELIAGGGYNTTFRLRLTDGARPCCAWRHDQKTSVLPNER